MTLLPDGRVLAAGGSSELYDPVTARWSVSDSLNSGFGGGTATLLADGRVLAVGATARDCMTPRWRHLGSQ